MKYDIITDIKTVLTLLDLSSSQLADELGVARSTIARILNKQTYPSDLFLESFYSYAYTNKHRQIRLNDLKIQFCKDKYDRILFHGAKDEIVTPIDLNHSRKQIDVGVGFYLGESYEQADRKEGRRACRSCRPNPGGTSHRDSRLAEEEGNLLSFTTSGSSPGGAAFFKYPID